MQMQITFPLFLSRFFTYMTSLQDVCSSGERESARGDKNSWTAGAAERMVEQEQGNEE
jgi:hypothetical protein